MTTIKLDLAKTARKLLTILILFEIFLVVMDLYTYRFRDFLPLQPIQITFGMEFEGNLPSWFSGIQLFLCSLLAFLIYFVDLMGKKQKKNGWIFTAFLFLYLSMDDVGHLHENIGKVFERIYRFQLYDTQLMDIISRYPSYPWQIILGPLFLIVGSYLLFFLIQNLAEKKLILLVLLSFCCVGTSIGLDFFEGYRVTPFLRVTDFFGHVDWFSHVLIVIEETFELIATSIILYVFCTHLSIVFKKQEILIKSRANN
ncbi:hypothetical protein KAJ27_02795 [bacterium]|nr:hypothetical protein [bacterium]